MKIYKDVLDPEFAKKLYNYGKERVTGNAKESDLTQSWLNLYQWDEKIVHDSTAVFCCMLPDRLLGELKQNLIDYNKLDLFDESREYLEKVMCYVWTQGSYIPIHDDGIYKKAVTIYLNENWKEEFGGQINWLEDGVIKTFTPEFNSAALNDTLNIHSTSKVTVKNSPRITIQMFFTNFATQIEEEFIYD